MRKVHFSFGLALCALFLAVASVAEAGPFTATTNPSNANQVVMTYDPASGNVSFNGNGRSMTTVELLSAGGQLIPGNVAEGVLSGPFDLINSGKFFKLATPPGVANLEVGAILPAGLSVDALLADLQIDGSLNPSGKFTDAEGGAPGLYVVPEPSCMALVGCGLLGLLGLRRKRG